jgi:hypothetical protein
VPVDFRLRGSSPVTSGAALAVLLVLSLAVDEGIAHVQDVAATPTFLTSVGALVLFVGLGLAVRTDWQIFRRRLPPRGA